MCLRDEWTGSKWKQGKAKECACWAKHFCPALLVALVHPLLGQVVGCKVDRRVGRHTYKCGNQTLVQRPQTLRPRYGGKSIDSACGSGMVKEWRA